MAHIVKILILWCMVGHLDVQWSHLSCTVWETPADINCSTQQKGSRSTAPTKGGEHKTEYRPERCCNTNAYPIRRSSQDKYLLVYCSPWTSGSSVPVTHLRIVDWGVLALTGGCGRYERVIQPSSTGWSALPFYCTVQIKGVTRLRFFFLFRATLGLLFIPVLD